MSCQALEILWDVSHQWHEKNHTHITVAQFCSFLGEHYWCLDKIALCSSFIISCWQLHFKITIHRDLFLFFSLIKTLILGHVLPYIHHLFLLFFKNPLCTGLIASCPRPIFYKYIWGKKLSFSNFWFSWRCCSLIHKQIQIHSQALLLLGWNDRYRAASNWCSSGRKSYEWLEEERANKWTLRHLSALWYLEGLDTELILNWIL